MLLKCNATWIATDTGSRYEKGCTYDVNDARATAVYYAAPEGTFDVVGADPPIRPRVGARPAPVSESISETTASGMTVPDRRARGGNVRSSDDCPWKRCDYVNSAVDKQRALTSHLARKHGGRRPGA